MEWKSDYFTYAENKIHYFHGDGDKNPLILLHGAMDNGLCWSPVAQKLSENYRVIMPDARGHGLTEILDNSLSIDLMAKDIAMFIQNLKLETPQIMGHSMGAQMTALIASKYPELVSRIVLEDPVIRFNKISKLRKGLFKFLAKIIVSILIKGSYEKLIKRGRKQNPKWSDEELQPWAESKILFRENNPKILKGILDNPPDWKDVFQKIACPILLITSDKGITSDKTARSIVDLSKECKWIKIEGAGHNIRREQFERFMQEIQDFLVP
ncbi:MAG: alpha/beta hydrolase [Candidatus Lokiarchaeota archaeon]|nr:alpha/beta hydrolase [Candidatus Lokiarchaeota archaeon]